LDAEGGLSWANGIASLEPSPYGPYYGGYAPAIGYYPQQPYYAPLQQPYYAPPPVPYGGHGHHGDH